MGASVETELVSATVKTWIADDLTYSPPNADWVQHREYGHKLLRQPLAWGVHFAGTETEAANGHVEGAIAAGERAASEVLRALL